MHIEFLQRCTVTFPGLQGAHRCAFSHAARKATQQYLPLQIARLDGRVVQHIRARSRPVEQSFKGVSASSSRNSRRKNSADQTLPVTPEVVLIALPVLIVAIPWAVGHLQLCFLVATVIALSPFGTVIWSLVSPSSGRPIEQQQRQRWRSSLASAQSTDQAKPFWPVESPLLREPSLVVEADVLGPSDEMPQSRGNSSYRAQVVPPHSYQQSNVRSTGTNISTPTSTPQRQALRKHRRLGRERGLARAGARDSANGADSTAVGVSKTRHAGNTVQQAAQDFVAPLQPTAAGFWESESLSRGRTRPLLTRILRRVPFVGTWGGLL